MLDLLGFQAFPGGKRAKLARSAERYQTSGLSCPLGVIVDMSSTGMKISCPNRPPLKKGDTFHTTIAAGGKGLRVMARVAWVRRVTWKSADIGVAFINVDPATAKVIDAFAKHGFYSGGLPEPEMPAAPKAAPKPPASASIEVEDLYKILGVLPTSDEDSIHAAYRRLARTLHPDVCKDPNAEARFSVISKAYAVLRDEQKRARYDELLKRAG